MIVYSLLYLRNFHYFHYFVIAHAYCKRVCWMLLGVMWINKISIYLSVITYAPSEERRTDDVPINTILLCYKTNRFYVAVRLFSLVAQEAQPSVSLMFLPRSWRHLDLLLNTRTATWNLFANWFMFNWWNVRAIDNWLHIFAHFQGVSRRSLFCSFLHIFWQNLQGDCFALQNCH